MLDIHYGVHMNKYLVTLHTFCDACFNQRTCKGTCKRMQELEKFVAKYEHLARAYDKACEDVSRYKINQSWDYADLYTKYIIKKEYLDDTK